MIGFRHRDSVNGHIGHEIDEWYLSDVLFKFCNNLFLVLV
jgi:hypothetical protein